ncbi:tRNA (adenosine(37)-N6)-threonylcarbamoyltransferase complex dimerization subunit type 1 TsaB [Sansalvadorimonas verongulae]|uniref:tRNA (adenosine(37)-N6)-threonylcarbamoyltransferase complex dimerization subunit type 1 TsaB n=1 Tax=Sansalvadorimonas verongulae TaxID=2172824 RepID=UPI0012BD2BB1|nr:tRNA (adenosine(37)-N6)-threonylcarbamoyltransferase complex dimerization subunit type 1 TsaB [Sansalvadorimonas verongulae]MTI12879.1 tRNA (adenosine(37)-N6)-threonylcarbamoyltransferase complex dimerization subunit type 1 TsaB [Sansalvadorimonas verongulae]
MALILALDTATEACSVALNDTSANGGKGEVQEIYEVIPRQHSQRLLPMIDELLTAQGVSRSQIDAIAFGRGPGAFTGVRIATGVAQGLGWALDCPVVPVSTLAALAQQAYREQGAAQVLSAIDARMDEVYWGVFSENNGLMVPVQDEVVCAPELTGKSLPEGWQGKATGIGSGWIYRDRMDVTLANEIADTFPHAADIAVLAAPILAAGDAVPASQALPVYLRDNVALKKSER